MPGAATAVARGAGGAAAGGKAAAGKASAKGGARANGIKKATKPKGKAGQALNGGKATKSDVRRLKSEAAAGDLGYQEAYEAGLAGEGFESSDPATQQAYEAGLEERQTRETETQQQAQQQGAQQAQQGRRSLPSAPDWVNDGAGFLLGLFAYALTLNFLQGGSRQARGWMAAKFLNKPYGGGQG